MSEMHEERLMSAIPRKLDTTGHTTVSQHLGAQRISDVSQIPDVAIAHYTDEHAGTGCTVIVCPQGAVGGIDVRGGAPATRETDLLRPEETVDVVHAVVLSGGSAFGLSAASGVAEELERRGIGLDVTVAHVPIVTSACVFDLAFGDSYVRPSVANGAAAAAEALDHAPVPLPRGNVGAGTGCTIGKLRGPEFEMKGGLGTAVEQVGDLVCGAISAVNASGNIVDPDTGAVVAGMRTPQGDDIDDLCETALEFAARMPLKGHTGQEPDAPVRTNTTVSCIITNARLNKAEATKVAQMAADGYAHAIRPTHTTNDGDTIFVLATGHVSMPIDVVGILATRAVERAIVDGVRSACTSHGIPGVAQAAE